MDTTEIDNILKQWLNKNGFSQYVVESGIDFEFFYLSNTIVYCFVVPTVGDKIFSNYFKELGLKYDADIFLLSFFHELGHGETINDIPDEEYYYSLRVKEYISTIESQPILYEIYQHLPDERAATRWAVEYINNHFKEVNDLWKKLQPAIIEFYKKNNIEIEDNN